jgi:undecaprenyl-diphosphatase
MDAQLFAKWNSVEGGAALDALARLAADSMLGIVLGLVALVALLVVRRDRRAVQLAVAVALSVGITDLAVGKGLKPAFQRPRPCHVWPETTRLRGTQCGGLFGFPSNHAANNAAIVAALAGQVARPWVIAYAALVAFIAWSRVYVGAHFPGDVLAGLLFGAFVGWATRRTVIRISLRLQRRGSRSKL